MQIWISNQYRLQATIKFQSSPLLHVAAWPLVEYVCNIHTTFFYDSFPPPPILSLESTTFVIFYCIHLFSHIFEQFFISTSRAVYIPGIVGIAKMRTCLWWETRKNGQIVRGGGRGRVGRSQMNNCMGNAKLLPQISNEELFNCMRVVCVFYIYAVYCLFRYPLSAFTI